MRIKIIKNDKLWMEQDAIHQLEKIALYEGVSNVVGLPDLHSGKAPVGATIETKNIIYPALVGNDIGCGMSLFNTNVKLKKFNVDKVIKKLEGTKIYGEYSIGGGNHFTEFQCIDKIFNDEYADELGIDKKNLYILVHSGSRRLGEEIYQKYGYEGGLKTESNKYKEYLEEHNKAVEYAKDNRTHLADIIMDMIGMKCDNQCVVDTVHNYLEIIDKRYLHHKGSISTLENKYAIIAGSRGSYTYLVKCIPNDETLNSISHGAGRKWNRTSCKGRLESKYKRAELLKSKLGSTVIVNDINLLYEEASEAYKSIEDVIQILLDYKCIELVARLKPVVTYKC